MWTYEDMQKFTKPIAEGALNLILKHNSVMASSLPDIGGSEALEQSIKFLELSKKAINKKIDVHIEQLKERI